MEHGNRKIFTHNIQPSKQKSMKKRLAHKNIYLHSVQASFILALFVRDSFFLSSCLLISPIKVFTNATNSSEYSKVHN